jgi:DNA mismatch endonuclease, patch repair protein
MDKFSREQRSLIMSSVKNKNSKAELRVRYELHRTGYRFRLHRKDLLGKPDIVLPKYKTIIFIHGCFWHRHGCKRTTTPCTNIEYWETKFCKNVSRFNEVKKSLEADGWNVQVIWECESVKTELLKIRLGQIFEDLKPIK